MNNDLQQKIKEIVQSHNVILFMKGDKEMPACGFSAGAVAILEKLNVDFESVNILSSEELRSAVKQFSDWPTYPQLYIKGEFIGGYDIMHEMFESGELEELVKNIK